MLKDIILLIDIERIHTQKFELSIDLLNTTNIYLKVSIIDKYIKYFEA